MKFAKRKYISAIAWFTLLAVSLPLSAQNIAKQNHHHQCHH
ncbi:MAG TPA: hypothetical protein VFE61_10190 [Candidatus Sulfotelmatobacter sp.]|nr:hypothetical protein [Candidatus Sulfotelmatobacter sp.]